MAWIYLFIAGAFEIFWAFAMKQSDGFTRLWPSIAVAGGMLASLGFLALAMRSLPLGISYTIWTGIGAVGAFVAGWAFLGETVTVVRAIAVLLIVSGLVLLKMTSSA